MEMKKILLILLCMAGMARAVSPTYTPSLTYTPSPTPNATQTPHVVNYDNSLATSMSAGTLSESYSFTVGTGSSPAMLVHVLMPLTAPVPTPTLGPSVSSDHVAKVTYAGVAAIHYGSNKIVPISPGQAYELSTFYILKPASGANTLTITLSTTESAETLVGAISYSNVWYLENYNLTQTANVQTVNPTLYTGSVNGLLTGCFAANTQGTGITLTAAPGLTNRAVYSAGTESAFMSLDDLRLYTPGSTTINWSYLGTLAPALGSYVEAIPR